MQHKIITRGPLLDENGHLTEAGYSTSLVLDYDRSAIRGGKLRIKEWDYYLITNGHIGVALTIADNSYMGLDSISFLDFDEGWEITRSPMRIMTMGKTGFPATSSKGDVEIFGKDYFLSFKNDGSGRTLSFKMDKFRDGDAIRGEIKLANPLREAVADTHSDTMVISTPFPEKQTAFYYNQKINCMPAGGFVDLGDRHIDLGDANNPQPDAKASPFFGLLDWGRGVWTYKNTWYWGSASGMANGKPFGFNLGYGFGDTSAASENMLFYDGVAHKLSQVTFNIPKDDNGNELYEEPWTFTSDDGRFEMDFVPVMDRASKTDFKILCSDQHQVFGRFTGKAILDDGTEIEIKDFFGFAEKVFNKW
ncbi:MAG: DUF2804 domain-containing protein [Bacillota bacterium]|nr:DUF2804 domain-containing protein [Bacillota bacterium]